jgi:hypothetical protein
MQFDRYQLADFKDDMSVSLGGEFHRIEVDMVFISEKFDKKTKETL